MSPFCIVYALLGCVSVQPAVFRAHTYSQFHKGPVFVDLFNNAWLGTKPRTNETFPCTMLINRIQKDAAAKPAKFSFSWMSDTVSMLGKNADILTVRLVAGLFPFLLSCPSHHALTGRLC